MRTYVKRQPVGVIVNGIKVIPYVEPTDFNVITTRGYRKNRNFKYTNERKEDSLFTKKKKRAF